MNIEIFKIITYFGDASLWIIIGIIIFWYGKEDFAKKFILLIIIDVILNKILKFIFNMPRPPEELWLVSVEDYYGFPSGHTETAFTVATYLSLRNPRYVFMYLLAVLVGCSRVVLGVHYVIDVIGGALFGIIVTLCYWYYNKWDFKIKNNKIKMLSLIVAACVTGYFLYNYFPVRPYVIAGFTSAYILTYIYSYDSKIKKSVVKIILGILSIIIFLMVYVNIGYSVFKFITIFFICIWSFILYPYIYDKISHSNI